MIATSCLKLLLLLLQTYRYFISPCLGNHCRFYPSCSNYAQEALTHFGIAQGLWMTIRRLLRCHPFHPGGYDPVILDHKLAPPCYSTKTRHHPYLATWADRKLTDKDKEI